MANNATAISGLVACTATTSTDFIMISSNTAGNVQSLYVTANTLLNNTSSNVSSNVISGATIVVTGNSVPANNVDNDSRPNNSIWADDNYIYVWNGTVIKRAALSTF